MANALRTNAQQFCFQFSDAGLQGAYLKPPVLPSLADALLACANREV